MSVEWASQILFHLSAAPSMNPFDISARPVGGSRLEPDAGIVEILSFAIDHYYVVM